MKILLFISVLMVLPSTSWACGWALLKAPTGDRLELEKQITLLKKAEVTFPKGWLHIESFDTARECENGKTYVTINLTDALKKDANKFDLSSSQYQQRLNFILIKSLGMRCIPFDYLTKLAGHPKADFKYDLETGKLIPLK